MKVHNEPKHLPSDSQLRLHKNRTGLFRLFSKFIVCTEEKELWIFLFDLAYWYTQAEYQECGKRSSKNEISLDQIILFNYP